MAMERAMHQPLSLCAWPRACQQAERDDSQREDGAILVVHCPHGATGTLPKPLRYRVCLMRQLTRTRPLHRFHRANRHLLGVAKRSSRRYRPLNLDESSKK